MPTLFAIETDAVRVVWSLRKMQAKPVLPAETSAPFGLEVTALQKGVVPAAECTTEAASHLFEQTIYTVLVQNKAQGAVRMRHRDPVLLQGLHRAATGDVVHGTLNFGTQVGRSRFIVNVDGRPHLAFGVEVFPSKISYRQDYEALRADVQDIAADLALAYLRATYAPSREVPHEASGTVAWLLMLRHVVDDLTHALAYINQQPAWGTERRRVEERTFRIRRVDSYVRRAVRRGGGHGDAPFSNAVQIRERLPSLSARYTLDTPAHRWLAAQVRRIRQQLGILQEAETRHRPGLRRQGVQKELDAMQHRLLRLEQQSPLREATPTPVLEPPLRLLQAPGYREAYRACLQLQQGLSLQGGPLQAGLQDLHVLYEYWCYLTLVRLVAGMVGTTTPWSSLIAVERYGVQLRLQKGRAHTVRFALGQGQRLDVTYNPRFGGRGYLVPQQPDILLTLHGRGSRRVRYVLDAKYRLDASPAYQRRYGAPGPPTDALNALHRYRDALREGKNARPVAQALALFPLREETPGRFAESKLYRMLSEIGVGALPLLPGQTGYLEAWLRTILPHK